MKHKIGDIVLINEEWFQCVEGRCKDCHFSEKRYLCKQFIIKNICTSHIIFKKLEKVGEPFERNGYLYQEYKAYNYPLLMNGDAKIPTANGFAVIIKQNKEDMEEEREYSEEEFKNNPRFQHHKPVEQVINMKKMKPFNLEQAKAGKPVCTRDGRKARIICFDAKGDKPIIALIEMGVAETPNNYPIDGKAISTKETPCDLMMLPEKKEGWVNLWRHESGTVHPDGNVYSSKEEAVKIGSRDYNYVDTVKIEWEE